MSQKQITHLSDDKLVRALAHPLRARILGILEERRASPRELSDELDAPLGTVSYHFRTLAQLKLIKLVKKTPRRGAIEHHYEAVGPATVSDAAWAASPAIVKSEMVRSALGEISRSVNEAAALGGFDRADAHLTRTRLTLDEQGWEDLGDALMTMLAQAEKIQEASAKRLRKPDHGEERRSALVMMLFEGIPSVDDPSSLREADGAASGVDGPAAPGVDGEAPAPRSKRRAVARAAD
jgi:DNA-binding transcriptional ArsR family regulator